ncbi:MAG: acyltransferase domain-containing protein [Acidobacteria bacterium]|nr:acyltransferase domain-containing protein [Acidobacteriota bacterium]
MSESTSKLHGREVAIVGIACSYPGARNKEQFWNNIVQGVDAVTEVSPKRWDPAVFYDPDPDNPDKIYCKLGGWIGDSFSFNPLKHGVMPSALKGTEPDHLLVLRTVYEALEDAGILPHGKLNGVRTSVIVGKGNYQGPGATALMYRGIVCEIVLKAIQDLHPEFDGGDIDALRARLRRELPPFNGEVAGGLIPNICTGRVANRMDFMGRNFTIDAACASSLIATEIAIQDLSSGAADLVLAGGVHIFAHVPFLQVFDAMRAMSLSSTIRPFDEHCDGTMSGEGVGILALKRLVDAERDGDRIYAVIKGAGSSSDGKAKGVTTPRIEGEELAMRRAYEMAGVDPRTVDLVEGHGTGTAVGDASEAAALQKLFGSSDRGHPYCAVGSVKSMIGHAMPAAGAAGLIKAALSVYHGILPPTLHCETPRADLSAADSAFYVNTETRPWIRPRQEGPRRAGVSAFGFGGVNAHIILEQHRSAQPEQTLLRRWPNELVTLSAATRPELLAEIDRVRRYALAADETELRDLACTLNTKAPGAFRLAIVADSMADVAAKLAVCAERLKDDRVESLRDRQGLYFFSQPEIREGKVAIVFPGEGSQYLDMLSDLCLHFPVVREAFERADGARSDVGRKPTSAVVFPPPSFSAEERAVRESELYSIDRATEAVLTGNGGIYRLLEQLGVQADMMSGHSAGEWVALAASGVLDIDQFVDNLSSLGRLYERLADRQDIPKMTMLAVGAGRDKVREMLASIDKKCEIANDNCPHQVVVVIAPEDEAEVVAQLRSMGVFVERLPYDRGYHTSAFTYICEPLGQFFASLDIRRPGKPLYCSTTAAPYPADRESILEQVTQTFSRPLLFRQTVEQMYADGARIFIEAGPRGNLTAFIDDILRGKPHVAAPVDHFRRDGISGLHHALAMLFAAGVDMTLAPLYERRDSRAIQFDPQADRRPNPDQEPGCVEVSTCYPHLAPLDPLPAAKTAPASAKVHEFPAPAGPSAAAPRPSAPAPVAAPTPAPAPPPPPAQQAPAPAAMTYAAPQGVRDAVVNQHLELMDEFLATHEMIMQAALGGLSQAPPAAPVNGVSYAPPPPTPPPTSLAPPPAPAPAAPAPQTYQNGAPPPVPVVQPAAPVAPPAVPAPVPEPVVASSSGSALDYKAMLLEVVSERTGYPEEMLELDLDLEADLGIDSIKRVEILGALQEMVGPDAASTVDMEAVAGLKTLREVIAHLEGGASASTPAALPFEERNALTRDAEIVEQVAGKSLLLRCPISTDDHRYLYDHCLYFNDSEFDNQLPPILSMPQTGNLEMMAETAARLFPGKKVIGARAVRSLRWVNFQASGAPVHLLLKARALDASRVEVSLSDERSPKDILSQAVIDLADDYPAPPEPISAPLEEPRRPEKAGDNPYDEHRFFHGPSFQGILDLHTVGCNGVDAQLKTLPRHELLRGDAAPRLWTDPFLLDAGGQLVGYWPNEYVDEGFVVLPVGLQQLTLYGPVLEPGVTLDCRVRIKSLTERQLSADFDIVDASGKLALRVEGWTDWRFYWSNRIYEFWRFSDRAYNGEPLRSPAAPHIPLRFIEDLDETERKGLWQDMWMRVVLNPAEYSEYQAMADGDARTEWAFVRAAEKDVARDWVKRNVDRDLYPCDVTVAPIARGMSRAAGPWFEAEGEEPPYIATAYRDRVSYGAAAKTPVALTLAADAAESAEALIRRAVAQLLGPIPAQLAPPAADSKPWTATVEGSRAFATIVESAGVRMGLAWKSEE